MIIQCSRCGKTFDDADRTTICPHPLIMPAEDLERKKAALELIGKDLCFAHEPNGPVRRVQAVGWNGMVTIAGMAGEFAPHLFVPAKEKNVMSSVNHRLDNDGQVFFYMDDFYPLHNFTAFRLRWRDIDFDTSEHAYQWEKFFGVEGAHYIRVGIINARSAHEAFKIAGDNKALRRPDWDVVKVNSMLGILRSKVAQHDYVRRKLLDTGDRELIEDSWRDDYWGWGPNRDGQNMLGKLWMRIRAELRASVAEKV